MREQRLFAIAILLYISPSSHYRILLARMMVNIIILVVIRSKCWNNSYVVDAIVVVSLQSKSEIFHRAIHWMKNFQEDTLQRFYRDFC
jgi:hypothetical protein